MGQSNLIKILPAKNPERQDKQCIAPVVSAKNPGSQEPQNDELEAPWYWLDLPEGQSTQASYERELNSEYFPPTQFVHSESEINPELDDHFPREHALHVSDDLAAVVSP